MLITTMNVLSRRRSRKLTQAELRFFDSIILVLEIYVYPIHDLRVELCPKYETDAER